MSGREQRFVFGEVAAQYDRARPSYPAALVDDILALAPGRALEVGCGTGKATVLFAGRGLSVVALEPSAPMARVARARTAGLPVRIVDALFEAWTPDAAYDLLYAAQAWHWVEEGVRYTRAHDALRPGGTIALFWNRPEWPDRAVGEEIDNVYHRVAPALADRTRPRPRWAMPDAEDAAEIVATGLFGDLQVREYLWTERYTPAAYVDLLGTYSDHRVLPVAQRAKLHAAIARVIGARGGELELFYKTVLYTASRV